jgi:hypothetical protein
MEYYATSLQHILAELERIDLLIQVQLQRLQHNQSNDTAFQELYRQSARVAIATVIGWVMRSCYGPSKAIVVQ